MAQVLGYSDRRCVWPYFNTDRVFPAEHCPALEQATRELGKPVFCEELRPDVAWEVVRNHRGPAKRRVAAMQAKQKE